MHNLKNISVKRAILMGLSLVCMAASYFVDGALAEEDTRELIRDEISRIKEEEES